MDELFILLLAIIILIAIWICGPLVAIWAINTLFGTTIAYTLLNWFAALLLMGLLKGTCSLSSKKK